MAKIGDGVPRIIDKTVDFMASSQAFMEYLKKIPAFAARAAGNSAEQRGAVSESSGVLQAALPAGL